MLTITYFVHGTTTDNERDFASGWNDVGLSELGIKQARELRGLLGNTMFDAVFCSDLKRAVDSARLGFDGLAPIITDERLRECNYGTLNGKPDAIVKASLHERITAPFPEGESYGDVEQRVAGFLDFLKKQYGNKHIAIVAHQGPQLALDVLLKGKTWPEAFAEDWRNTKSWQPGWEYILG